MSQSVLPTIRMVLPLARVTVLSVNRTVPSGPAGLIAMSMLSKRQRDTVTLRKLAGSIVWDHPLPQLRPVIGRTCPMEERFQIPRNEQSSIVSAPGLDPLLAITTTPLVACVTSIDCTVTVPNPRRVMPTPVPFRVMLGRLPAVEVMTRGLSIGRGVGTEEHGHTVPLRTQCVVLPLGGNSHAYTPQFGADPEANTSTRWMPVWRALTVAGGSFTERPWSAFGATPAATKSGRGTFAIASRTLTPSSSTCTATGALPLPGNPGSTTHPATAPSVGDSVRCSINPRIVPTHPVPPPWRTRGVSHRLPATRCTVSPLAMVAFASLENVRHAVASVAPVALSSPVDDTKTSTVCPVPASTSTSQPTPQNIVSRCTTW
eukprot:m.273171 g.273171  ORF g.273171 m.273171 type:complete len:374 (-) comp26880_c1_seq1:219-1340(-)